MHKKGTVKSGVCWPNRVDYLLWSLNDPPTLLSESLTGMAAATVLNGAHKSAPSVIPKSNTIFLTVIFNGSLVMSCVPLLAELKRFIAVRIAFIRQLKITQYNHCPLSLSVGDGANAVGVGMGGTAQPSGSWSGGRLPKDLSATDHSAEAILLLPYVVCACV